MSRTSIALFIVTILAGIGTLVLMSMVVKARRARLDAVESRFDKLGGLDQQILDDQRAVDALSTQLLTSQKEWGKVWPSAGNVAVVDQNAGVMELGIGLNAGLGVASRAAGGSLPTLHVFGISAGESKYIGEFKATAVENATTAIKLERTPYQGEADNWLADGYSVREAIPPSYNALEADLITSRAIAAQSLLEENQRLARANNQLEASQTTLDMRLDELTGNSLADEEVDELRAKGLVTMLDEKTTERDDLIASVDRLRRTYSQKSDELKNRLASVRALADQLPRQ